MNKALPVTVDVEVADVALIKIRLEKNIIEQNNFTFVYIVAKDYSGRDFPENSYQYMNITLSVENEYSSVSSLKF